MRKVDQEPTILSSILDRLLDGEPAQDLDQFKESVARDLEALFNTRHGLSRETLKELPSSSELRHSLFTYGLSDFLSFNLNSADDCNEIRRELEETIRNFEPRLDGISVTLDIPRVDNLTLRFSIKALLLIEPIPESVIFDATLQLNAPEASRAGNGSGRGHYVVRGHS